MIEQNWKPDANEIYAVEAVVEQKYSEIVGIMNRKERRSNDGKQKLAMAYNIAVMHGVEFLKGYHNEKINYFGE
jgi:hypothetical protein